MIVLVITTITAYGAVDVQQVTGFDSYQSCVAHAVARVETLPTMTDQRVRWECQREEP
jgi:hypothetical protein